MLVRNLRPELAVMNIFRGFAVKPQGALEMAQLIEVWPEYGLRGADLREAIVRLSRRGFVRIEGPAENERIVLTEGGSQWADSVPAWLEYTLLVPRRQAYQQSLSPGFAPSLNWTNRRRTLIGPRRLQPA